VTFKPSFRRQAFLDYTAAQRWYEKQRRGLGAHFQHEVDRAIIQACATPRRFAEVTAGIHYVRVSRFPFVIYYKVRGNKLTILAVFHVRRHPPTWQIRG
jgi:toxin ParE1/3/4